MASGMTPWACPDSLPAPKLLLCGPDGGGWLKLSLEDGALVAVWLYGRHVRVLLALNQALRIDKDLDEVARGWMSDECIAEAYALGDPRILPPSPEAIAAYRAQINRLIREQTPPGSALPRLLVSRRSVGVRLVQEIVIIDLQERRQLRESLPPDQG